MTNFAVQTIDEIMISRRFLRIKALKALYAHVNCGTDSLIPAQKKMLFSISKSYELYHLMLQLMVDLSDYSREVTDLAKNKQLATTQEKNPTYRFANNRLIEKIRNCENLEFYLKKNNLSWSRDNELMKNLYTTLTESDYYKKYDSDEVCGWKEDCNVVVTFLRREIEDNEFFYTIVEDMSLYWIDEIEYFTSRVAAQLSKQQENKAFKLLPLFGDQEDEDFVKELFVRSITHYDDNVAIIKQFARNWEVERITVMDRLIIIMAIVELDQFKKIPLNVSLDEYIEISKYYSTNTSSVFINGILDKYIKENNITK